MYQSSIEALVRRVRRGDALINGLVDLYNAVSLRYLLPVGGDDRARRRGTSQLVQHAELWQPDESPPALYPAKDQRIVQHRQQQWHALARGAALRGTGVAGLGPLAYGGYKDVHEAWMAGTLTMGDRAVASDGLKPTEVARSPAARGAARSGQAPLDGVG